MLTTQQPSSPPHLLLREIPARDRSIKALSKEMEARSISFLQERDLLQSHDEALASLSERVEALYATFETFQVVPTSYGETARLFLHRLAIALPNVPTMFLADPVVLLSTVCSVAGAAHSVASELFFAPNATVAFTAEAERVAESLFSDDVSVLEAWNTQRRESKRIGYSLFEEEYLSIFQEAFSIEEAEKPSDSDQKALAFLHVAHSRQDSRFSALTKEIKIQRELLLQAEEKLELLENQIDRIEARLESVICLARSKLDSLPVGTAPADFWLANRKIGLKRIEISVLSGTINETNEKDQDFHKILSKLFRTIENNRLREVGKLSRVESFLTRITLEGFFGRNGRLFTLCKELAAQADRAFRLKKREEIVEAKIKTLTNAIGAIDSLKKQVNPSRAFVEGFFDVLKNIDYTLYRKDFFSKRLVQMTRLRMVMQEVSNIRESEQRILQALSK